MSLAFSAYQHLINFSIFSFLYIRKYEPDMFRQIFFPVGF